MEKSLLNVLDFNNDIDIETLLLDKAKIVDDIVIFGAGIGGKATIDLLNNKALGQKVRFFSDNNPNKVGKQFCDRSVILPNEIKEKTKSKRLIIISSTAYDIVSKQLIEYGIDEEELYYFQLAGLSEKSEEKEYIRQHISAFESIYNKLQDEKSKIIYRCILNYRITNNIFYLKEMSSYIDSEETQYFDNTLLEQYCFETGFVDTGAYTGGTLSQMHKNLPDFSGEYYAFEAGKDIYTKLIDNCDKEKCGFQVKCFNLAVWNEEGLLRFDTSESDSGSKVNEDGEVVRCNSLDNLLKNCKIDFIKMDIEGSERKALEGAVDIIRNNKTIMAICIYHKREDFYDIPQLIESIIPNEYAFYIRQYRFGQSETVLYALPNSRKKVQI